jgi:CRISPR-associated protein Csm4
LTLTAIKLFKLAPRTALHFGQRGVGVEGTEIFCRADTLFSALCLTLRELDLEGGDSLSELLGQFPKGDGVTGSPPFRLTSAFPYAGDVLFFPKPLVPGRLDKEDEEEHGKTLKGVEFVSQDIFVSWLNDEPLSGYLVGSNFLHGGDLWVTPAEREVLEVFCDESGEIRLWEIDTVPRVTVDRVTNKSAVYQAGRVRYQRVTTDESDYRAGLWVLVEWPEGDPGGVQASWMQNVLSVLGDSGIGGERSAGYGQFDLEGPTDFTGFEIQGQGERWLTLAPYHPCPDEVGEEGVLGAHCAYMLLIRRGWVGSPEGMSYRRPLVRMLGEGSVLHHPAGQMRMSYGDLADVTPAVMDPASEGAGHKVWRYGIAFPVPVGIPISEDEEEA